MVTKICEVCGLPFRVKPYRADSARFCSFACGGTWRLKTHPMPNAHKAGNRFRAGLRPANAFMSEHVRGSANARWVDGETFTCEHCGKPFVVKPWVVRQNGVPRFCGRVCFSASGAFRGELSRTWVGGPKTYRGRGWRAARLLAVKRDGGRCADCGELGGASIPVHHVRPFREFSSAAEANAPDNLICLCQRCHMRAEYA